MTDQCKHCEFRSPDGTCPFVDCQKEHDVLSIMAFKHRAGKVQLNRFSVEPHGDGFAIYLDRDNSHHGLNLAHLSECTDDFAKKLGGLLNLVNAAKLLNIVDYNSGEAEAVEFWTGQCNCCGQCQTIPCPGVMTGGLCDDLCSCEGYYESEDRL